MLSPDDRLLGHPGEQLIQAIKSRQASLLPGERRDSWLNWRDLKRDQDLVLEQLQQRLAFDNEMIRYRSLMICPTVSLCQIKKTRVLVIVYFISPIVKPKTRDYFIQRRDKE